MSWAWGWRPYVSAAQKQANARRHARELAKQGRKLQPIQIAGRAIAKTFWGAAWCDNLERYSDFANRLPRGRTYARNGSILDLQITAGKIKAIVAGGDIYDVTIDIAPLTKNHWELITRDCSQAIDSVLDLLQGRLSDGVMERLTRPQEGLFPRPNEIKLHCSCPDWAGLCKHAAAVMYGVGARLDTKPELLFTLRKVDHEELIRRAVNGANLDAALGTNQAAALAGEDLGAMFGIDLAATSNSAAAAAPQSPAKRNARRQKAVASQTVPSGSRRARTPAKVAPARGVKATKAARPQAAKKRLAAKPVAVAERPARAASAEAETQTAKSSARGKKRVAATRRNRRPGK